MTIYIFGNPDLKMDCLPIKIFPELRKKFPEIEFSIIDPNEEWEVPEELIIIDTVVGIDTVKVFDDLKKFVPAPNISMHDFDAYANLRFLEKLGKLRKVKIIGVPARINPDSLLKNLVDIINGIYPSSHLTFKKCAAQDMQGS